MTDRPVTDIAAELRRLAAERERDLGPKPSLLNRRPLPYSYVGGDVPEEPQ